MTSIFEDDIFTDEEIMAVLGTGRKKIIENTEVERI